MSDANQDGSLRGPWDDPEFFNYFLDLLEVSALLRLVKTCKILGQRIKHYAKRLDDGKLLKEWGPCYAVQIYRARLLALEVNRTMAAAPLHTLITNTCGMLSAFGHGGRGKLGLGATFLQTATPRLVIFPYRIAIVQVAASHSHSLALSAGGKCFGWGSNEFGQLGDTYNTNCMPSPIEITTLANKRIREIACGDSHSLFLMSYGHIMSCGARIPAGHPHRTDTGHIYQPQVLFRLAERNIFIIQIAASGYHSLALDREGDVYSWGRGEGGCLGHGDDEPRIEPTLVRGLCGQFISKLDCGSECSAAYSKYTKRLFMWGVDHCGLSYITDYSDVEAWRRPTLCPGFLPSPHDSISFLALGGGLAGAVVATNSKRNAFQLRREDRGAALVARPLFIERPCIAAACADEHLVLALDDDTILVAGNGTHGRLGTGSHASLSTPTILTTLPWAGTPKN